MGSCCRAGIQAGRIREDGSVYDHYGSRVGKIESDGTVKDKYGSRVEKIDRDGTVRDKSGRVVGKSTSGSREAPAFRFFFN